MSAHASAVHRRQRDPPSITGNPVRHLGSAAAVVLAVALAIGLNKGIECKPLEYSAWLRGTELAVNPR